MGPGAGKDGEMSYVFTAPQFLASAATDVDGIAAAVGVANAAAAGPTANLLAAAGDEVSAATAALFNAYAREYQAVVRQAAMFQQEFTELLAAAAGAYTQAEAANAALVSGALNGALSNARDAVTTPIQSLLTSAAAGTGGSSALTAVPAAASQIALIMGGTGNPDPDPKYLNRINVKYIQHLFPGPSRRRSSHPSSSGRLPPNSAT
ncbi:PE family protein [Mycobacterium kansasii 732]|nr:PE family protein [Mycobacterium kansasii 732]